MLGTIVFLIITAAGSLFLFRSKKAGGNIAGGGKSWMKFFARGKDAGFSLEDLELLRRLAIARGLEDPDSLLWSQSQLDLCIRDLVRASRFSSDKATQDFLSDLFDYRAKREMEKPRFAKGITHTRQIEQGQRVRILLEGRGLFDSRIIRNTARALLLARPGSLELPPDFSWKWQKLSVYFWRGEDAGYMFDTVVEDEVFPGAESGGVLKASHGESLFRTQKRESIRVKTHKPAFLYVLEGGEPSTSIEKRPGLKAFIEDLSDTGCALTIGGKAPVGLRVKVQFALDARPLCISGTVRSIDYNDDENRSLLHTEADPMSVETRNMIRGEVFGMFPEKAEESGSVVTDEGAGGMTEGVELINEGVEMEQESAENSGAARLDDQSVVSGEALY